MSTQDKNQAYIGPVKRELPPERQSLTHRFRIGGQDGYITLGLYDDGTPGEVFINVDKVGSTISALVDAVAKLISHALQYGMPMSELVYSFKNMRFEPNGSTNNPDIPVATSIVDYVFRWIEMKLDGPENAQLELIPVKSVVSDIQTVSQDDLSVRRVDITPHCPDCNNLLNYVEGCFSCRNCGYTKCS